MNDKPELTGRHLTKDWIDTTLAEKIRRVTAKHYKEHQTENMFGELLATWTALITSMVATSNLEPKHKLAVMADIVNFMRELWTTGWENPTKRKPN